MGALYPTTYSTILIFPGSSTLITILLSLYPVVNYVFWFPFQSTPLCLIIASATINYCSTSLSPPLSHQSCIPELLEVIIQFSLFFMCPIYVICTINSCFYCAERYKFKLIEIVQQLDMVMLLDYRSIFGSWYMRTAVLLIPVSQ